jgi:hypothetical protein
MIAMIDNTGATTVAAISLFMNPLLDEEPPDPDELVPWEPEDDDPEEAADGEVAVGRLGSCVAEPSLSVERELMESLAKTAIGDL